MPPLRTYRGRCHCGAVRFAFTSELSYHYAHFQSETGFLILTGGVAINF